MVRWITADDPAKLTRFIEANRSAIANDLDGDYVYMAASVFSLGLGRRAQSGHQVHGREGGDAGVGSATTFRLHRISVHVLFLPLVEDTMDVESEIRDLKRRVGELEGTYGFLTGQLRDVHRAVLGFQEQTNDRFDRVDARFEDRGTPRSR